MPVEERIILKHKIIINDTTIDCVYSFRGRRDVTVRCYPDRREGPEPYGPDYERMAYHAATKELWKGLQP